MTAVPVTAAPPSPDRPAARCGNCDEPMLGPHCYRCGQPVQGLVRHFGTIVGDIVDTVFNFDSRTFRTLGPLLFRPGFLSSAYFAGHRVRYVSPVRLFVFLCLAAFFALHLRLGVDWADSGRIDASTANVFSSLSTADEVERQRAALIAELDATRRDNPDNPVVQASLEAGQRQIEAQAQQRIAQLRPATDAGAGGTDAVPLPEVDLAPPGAAESASSIDFGNGPWHAQDNPLRIDALPEAANVWLNTLIGRAVANMDRVQDDPRLLAETFLTTLPQTLFVLLPLFALLLKLAYLFKRRLYMEHLIVALYSHAFLCAALLLLVGLDWLRDQVGVGGLTHSALTVAERALMLWMPLYLLLAQKRAYGQGWFFTVLKFVLLGSAYFALVMFGVMLNLAFNLVAM